MNEIFKKLKYLILFIPNQYYVIILSHTTPKTPFSDQNYTKHYYKKYFIYSRP